MNNNSLYTQNGKNTFDSMDTYKIGEKKCELQLATSKPNYDIK